MEIKVSTNFLENKMNKFLQKVSYGNPPEELKPAYSDTEKLAKYVNISKRLQNSDGEDIFKLTGCLAACQRNEFQVKEKGTLKEDKIDGSDWMMNLGFYFPRGEWEEKDQVSSNIGLY